MIPGTGAPPALARPVRAVVDLDAVAHNAGIMARLASPAALCAVVKADGYGHGAVQVARAALAGGASWLGVAMVEEGMELRRAGLDTPTLLLSEPPLAAMDEVVRCSLTPTVYSEEALMELARAVRSRPAGSAGDAGPVGVHVKVDTGMHRAGADPEDVVKIVSRLAALTELRLDGLWTHLAAADLSDEVACERTRSQLQVFERCRVELETIGMHPKILHAASSAGLIAYPESRYGMARCGISLYGYLPSAGLSEKARWLLGEDRLVPAMRLEARVSHVRTVRAGEGVSYGIDFTLPVDSIIATVPLGYADGVPRGLSRAGGEVLLAGERRPIAGVVTMDQLMVDCGPRAQVRRGDEVVLLGRQGGGEITADDWAGILGTINYEVLSRVGARVPRVYRRDGGSGLAVHQEPGPGGPGGRRGDSRMDK